MRVLAVDDQIPQMTRDGASLRFARLLHLAADAGIDVALAGWSGGVPAATAERFAAAGIRVVGAGRDVILDAAVGVDVVVGSRPNVVEHLLPAIRSTAPRAAFVYDTMDLAHVRAYREARLKGSAPGIAQAVALKRLETGLAEAADVTVVVSEVEREVLATAAPRADVAVVSTPHDPVPDPRPLDGRRPDVLLVGYWPSHPNVDAALTLVDEVWPIVTRADPELRLLLVGPHPPPELVERAGPNVVVAGHVPDLRPVHDQVWCSAAPLRWGAGVKIKVLDCLAHGVPVVGSTVAWEGTGAVDGVHGLVADDPAAVAAAILRLRADHDLWSALHRNGPALVAERFGSAAVRRAFVAALERAVVRAADRVQAS